MLHPQNGLLVMQVALQTKLFKFLAKSSLFSVNFPNERSMYFAQEVIFLSQIIPVDIAVEWK